jgi:hypothetical protein
MDPTEPIDRMDPAEPIDRIDPLEPIDRIDPLEPMDRIDPLEPLDSIEPAERARRDERIAVAIASFSHPPQASYRGPKADQLGPEAADASAA